MQKQGVGIGDVVAICTNNHLDAYIPCIGALITGAIYNPWHHEVPLSKWLSSDYYYYKTASTYKEKH